MAYKGNRNMAIIGGGISGLATALAAIEHGQNPSKIHIYEGSDRLGGKIQSAMVGDRRVDAGAEFIDSNSATIDLVRSLGLNPIKATEQERINFQSPDGKLLSEEVFYREYAPITRMIKRDKDEIARSPNGLRAQQLNALTLKQYMAIAAANEPIVENNSVLTKLTNWFTGNRNRVNPDIIKTATSAYTSEVGQPASKISALQFVSEASGVEGKFLDSDSGYRVEGGMEQLIHAIKKRLLDYGMREDQFHMNATVDAVNKGPLNTTLSFIEPDKLPAVADQLVLALPTYCISKIRGLDTLGLTPNTQDFIKNLQYANNIKFIIKLKPGVKPPEANFFSSIGYQCWSPEPGLMSFIVNAEKLQHYKQPGTGEKPSELVAQCLDNYARAHGTTIDAVFDTSPGNILFNDPGNSPCYATPQKNQVIQLKGLEDEMKQIKDVALVGTFLPGPNGEVGFLGCALRAAKSVAASLIEDQQRPQWLGQKLERPARDPLESTATKKPDEALLASTAGRGILS
jgi:monoamine oxidase